MQRADQPHSSERISQLASCIFEQRQLRRVVQGAMETGLIGDDASCFCSIVQDQ